MITYKDPVSRLKGVGPKKELALEKLKISTLGDLLYHFPRTYQDRRNPTQVADLGDEKATLIRVKILRINDGGNRYGSKTPLRLFCEDQSKTIEVLFFNAYFFRNTFQVGKEYEFYGKPRFEGSKVSMVHPEFNPYKEGQMEGIRPVYPLTGGISQLEMLKYQRQAVSALASIIDYMPLDIRERNRLCDLSFALKNIHFPENELTLKQGKFRLVFDELFLLQTGLLARNAELRQAEKSHAYKEPLLLEKFQKSLSFRLTGAQDRVMKEVFESMDQPLAMARLIQGDVGSGKTVIAAAALYKAAKNHLQGVMMVPTELLARQHYQSLREFLEPQGLSVHLLVSSMTTKDKEGTLQAIKDGQAQVIVGTHAIIQPGVEFHNLSLVITDEQHRFGVDQRIALGEKGQSVDTLVMSATPIPRTLAAILYGDLDISLLDEMPPGRQKILTYGVRSESKRSKMYDFVESQLEKGHQCYVVTPLIEESEVLEAKSAEEVHKELAKRYPSYNVALLHGSMSSQDKEKVMIDFQKGEVDLLVATVVIEVGINVPNASVMVVENAERFGLAQLHQLRGRVGRGLEQSYCFLVSSKETEYALARMEIMTQSTDGFYIAEKDLELRGPGEVFGTKQHGLPELIMADLSKHLPILQVVKEEARDLLNQDPILENHPLLKEKINRLLKQSSS
ncbi:MAG: ATP-dependent DNA helicase RecG [Anaerovoracaceae bacterium]|jgi:ATP-dependent DNA helicase RecG|nr:ATP-dependent DNA helicase RecG [Anaerovoracaceae bacterium]